MLKPNEKEKLAEQLHIWYLEACQQPESGMDFNPAAQEPYQLLPEGSKFLDRYIAQKVLAQRDANWAELVKAVEGINEPPALSEPYFERYTPRGAYHYAIQQVLALLPQPEGKHCQHGKVVGKTCVDCGGNCFALPQPELDSALEKVDKQVGRAHGRLGEN